MSNDEPEHLEIGIPADRESDSDNDFRPDIRENIRSMITQSIDRCHGLMSQELPPTSKFLVAHFTACRSALNQVEHLLELERLIVRPQSLVEAGQHDEAFLAELVNEAREALADQDDGTTFDK